MEAGMAKRTDVEMEAKILQAYHDGEGGVRLAHRLGVGVSTVYHVLNRHGIQRRPRSARPRRFTDEQERSIAARYAKNGSSAAIASELGCSAVLVRSIARRHGVDVGSRGGKATVHSDDRIADIVRRYGVGESQENIARHHGIGQASVSRVLRDAGITSGSRAGEKHWHWAGGRARVGSYVGVRVDADSPYAAMRSQTGYVLEHRLVLAQKLGRPLTKHETVHHINGDRTDNRPENLQLRQGRHGKGQALVCGDCGSHNIVHATLDDG